MLQSEYGDIYKVNIDHTEGEVHNIKCQYFDTIPPCNSMCITKLGYLFAACEQGNQLFFKFKGLGDDEKNPKISDSTMDDDKMVSFYPRKPINL